MCGNAPKKTPKGIFSKFSLGGMSPNPPSTRALAGELLSHHGKVEAILYFDFGFELWCREGMHFIFEFLSSWHLTPLL